MNDREYSTKQLAREMDAPYITIYTIIERREQITGMFVTRFIRRFGMDEAKNVFQSFLAPIESTEATA
jgi:plasmid maintenance system antidote protein VapI